MNERVAAATAAGKEDKTGAGFDLLTEAGMKLEHLALLASIAPLVVLAALVCHCCLELAVVGSKQWLG
jgi:hypothetical protein